MTTTHEQTIRDQNWSICEQWLIECRTNLPIDTPKAFALAELCGYRVDRNILNDLFQSKTLAKPPKSGKQFAWQETHILDLLDALEDSRRWKPGARRHESKLTERERLEHSRKIGIKGDVILKYSDMPAESILASLVDEQPDREKRTAMISIVIMQIQLMNKRIDELKEANRALKSIIRKPNG